MIIRQDKSYETHSMYLNENFYPDEEGILLIDETTQEGQRLAQLVIDNSPYFDIVTDGNDNIIDIFPLTKPINLYEYKELRKAEYPPLGDFADAYVKLAKGDSTPMNEYISTCLAVKAKYPKPEELL